MCLEFFSYSSEPEPRMRRLPVYLLLDCSASMQGATIEAVRHGVEQFIYEIQNDTFARETVVVGLITFDSDARMVLDGLRTIDEFQREFEPSMLKASGLTSLGKALQILANSLDTDVRPIIPGEQRGDWKPLVFILTDGKPTDEWQEARDEILSRKFLTVITVGCGADLNETTLKEIGMGPTFYMDNRTSVSFSTFFKWVSDSLIEVSSEPNWYNESNESIKIL